MWYQGHQIISHIIAKTCHSWTQVKLVAIIFLFLWSSTKLQMKLHNYSLCKFPCSHRQTGCRLCLWAGTGCWGGWRAEHVAGLHTDTRAKRTASPALVPAGNRMTLPSCASLEPDKTPSHTHCNPQKHTQPTLERKETTDVLCGCGLFKFWSENGRHKCFGNISILLCVTIFKKKMFEMFKKL